MKCTTCYDGTGCEGARCLTTQLRGMVSDTAPLGGSWAIREDVATRIGGMDFGCDFNDCGECAGQHNSSGCNYHREAGCCTDCAAYIGYLKKIPPEALAPLVALYNPHLGYWTPGGCSIPQKWRSNTCLTYHCMPVGNKTSVKAKRMLRCLPILEVV